MMYGVIVQFGIFQIGVCYIEYGVIDVDIDVVFDVICEEFEYMFGVNFDIDYQIEWFFVGKLMYFVFDFVI